MLMKILAPLFFCFILSCQVKSQQNSKNVITADEEIGNQCEVNHGKVKHKNHNQDKLSEKYIAYMNNYLPKELLKKYITSINLFTDGEDNTLASMSAINPENTEWEVSIDTLDVNLKRKEPEYVLQYTHTFIHEFGHLFTLNAEQVEYSESEEQTDDSRYLTQEGLARKKSYVNAFVRKFWNMDLLTEWDKTQEIESPEKKAKSLEKFYKKRPSEFVTQYASESPEEDIAESWTFFVLFDKPKNNSKANEKILFFYNYPELVKYREAIRNKTEYFPNISMKEYAETFR